MPLFSSNDIKIEIGKFIYNPGETVSGKVITSIEKTLKADKLFLRFYGVRTLKNTNIRGMGADGYSNTTYKNTETFGEQNIILGGEGDYDSAEYPFSFVIPNDLFPSITSEQNTGPTLQIPGVSNETNDIINGIGKALLNSQFPGTSILGGANYQFFLEARLDIPWAVDLSYPVELTINRPLGDMMKTSSIGNI